MVLMKGCKKAETDVVYTLWSNLQKTADMEVGQIGYHDRHAVKKVKVVKNNSIVNRISKTKEERFPNLYELQQQRLLEIRVEEKAAVKAAKQSAREREKLDGSYM